LPLRITVLGCGTSMGVPQLGCRCAVCTSNDPRNHRTRPSIHLQQGNMRVLIDAPPELRLQLLATHLDEHLDAVLITHTHADHIMGLDDVRGFTLRTGKPMPVYAEASALHDLRRVFHYVFHPVSTWYQHAPDRVSRNPCRWLSPPDRGDAPSSRCASFTARCRSWRFAWGSSPM
jgi:phosphoribosyl 1,2-cyclic phosphodiesterase